MLPSDEVSKENHIMLHYILLALKFMYRYCTGNYVIRYFMNWLLSHVLILISIYQSTFYTFISYLNMHCY